MKIELKLKMVESNQVKAEYAGRNLFSYERKNLVREGDLVLFYESMDLSKQMIVKRGGMYQTTKGVVSHD
jgi:hypothetical protein